MIDVLSLCVGAFAACWGYILFSTVRYKTKHKDWMKTYSLACDDTCMCGSPINSHGWGDNHCAVSELDWYVSNHPEPKFK